MCYDWGESSQAAVLVLDGEAGWVSCPLFSHPAVYNYTTAQSAGHDLVWYRLLDGHDLEQPIPYSARVSRERERLWLQPAVVNDTGQYICMLRNKSSCSRIAVRLQVLLRDQAVRSAGCPQVAMAATEALIGFQQGKTLTCPNLQDASKMADSDPTVNWTYVNQDMSRCDPYPFWDNHREQVRTDLQIHNMLIPYEGLYFCTVWYRRRGGSLSFTRSIKVSGIYPTTLPKDPIILHPTNGKVFPVRTNSDVHLTCRGQLPFIIDKPEREIWWTVDGKRVEQLNDGRFSQTNSTTDDHRDLTAVTILKITDVQSEDLQRNFTCSVKNARGSMARWVQLEEEVSLPSVELGCGLGVTLVLMLLLFVVYHVFWLELLLLYRSWFGTDERHTDDKEFDVYISYARNSEEEQFVLSTLRGVLENELGYSVCIFDRDSLPGGNLSESILQSMQRSRRLLFVLSPDFLVEKSFSLLECRLGLYLQRCQRASILAVVRRSVSKLPCAEAALLRRAAICTATWRGRRSEPRRSRFWLRLRLALPVRPLALGRRLIDSTSSHSDLAALALQRAQRIRNQNRKDRAAQSRTGRRASANHRKTPSRGRGGVWREEGLQRSRRCSGCAGFMGQVEDRRVEIRGETQMQQELRNGTDAVSETDSIIPDPAHKTHSHAPSPNHAHDIHNPASSSDLALSGRQQEVDTSRTSEENRSGEKGEELKLEMAPTAPQQKTPPSRSFLRCESFSD
uniref:Interleukin 1 receptor accessory protein n=1 Tax=Xiphophorus maculatus TaxID=8083 RepID=M4AK07_XIPMA